MNVTSRAQYVAWSTSGVADLERVREDVWALPMLMEFRSLPSSLSYLIRDAEGGVHVVDPGTESEDNWGALVFALGRIGAAKSDVASIIVTHLHADHLGLAETLRRSTGAPLVLHRTEQEAMDRAGQWGIDDATIDGWGVPAARDAEVRGGALRTEAQPSVTADVLVDDGDSLAVPGRDIRVIHTPGHTLGHMVLRDVDARLLFTGDHVLPDQHPGLGHGGRSASNPVTDYLNSLERLRPFDDHEVLPGHGYRFTGLGTRVDALAEHHHRRAQEIASALEASPGVSVWDVASALTWTNGWGGLRGFYLVSALAQTAMHVERLRPAG